MKYYFISKFVATAAAVFFCTSKELMWIAKVVTHVAVGGVR
jgi:hypothetical protein